MQKTALTCLCKYLMSNNYKKGLIGYGLIGYGLIGYGIYGAPKCFLK